MRRIMVCFLVIAMVSGSLYGCSKKAESSKKYTSDAKSEAVEQPMSTTINFSENEVMMDMAVQEEGSQRMSLYGEGYAEIVENKFIDTETEAISTFSIDVDTASYANVRSMLEMGYMPDRDAVRIEEMINYFDYDYELPTGGAPFSVTTKIANTPWNTESDVVMIGIQGMEIPKEQLPASNLVFLLDVSGSMEDANKLPLLRESFNKLVENLDKKDRISIVVYAGAAGVVLSGAKGSEQDEIIDALNELQAGGSTAGGEGIELAYEIAKKYFIQEGNNRVILATDGDFNVGLSSVEELEDLISEKREDDIFLSVIGFGRGNIQDDIMETLADKGNGNYAYIDTLHEANKVFSEELTGTLFAIAKDVKVQVEFNKDYVESYRLIGYDNRMLNKEDFTDDTKDAGELGVGHEMTALYEIVPANGMDLSQVKEPIYTVKLRYKKPTEDQSMELIKDFTTKDFVNDLDNETDFLWALAVAEFGMILRDSNNKGDASLEDVKEAVRYCIQKSDDDYRVGFSKLIRDYEDIRD